MAACWEEEKVRKGKNWLGWGLGGPRGLPASTELCLDVQTVILAPAFPIPQKPWGRGPERPLLGGKAEWEVARATEFPWVLEKGGFLPSPTHPICL